MVFQF